MIMLFFLTKLSDVASELIVTWSLQTLTNSLISDQPTWTQLVPPLFNMHLLPAVPNPAQPLKRRYLNHATIGMRGYAHVRLLSVANSTFVTNARNLDTRVPTAHHDFYFFQPLHSFNSPSFNNSIEPPQVQLGVIEN
jgi:hypothetical protein